MIKWGEIKIGDTLVFLGHGRQVEIGIILAEPGDDRLVYYKSRDGTFNKVRFDLLEDEYKVIHNEIKGKIKPTGGNKFSNSVSIMKRLRNI